MSEDRWLRLALKALDSTGRRSTLRNQLVEIISHSRDPQLVALVTKVKDGFDQSDAHPSHTTMLNRAACKPHAVILRDYCLKQLDNISQNP